MKTHAGEKSENKGLALANRLPEKKVSNDLTFQFVDNRPESLLQRKFQETINTSQQSGSTSQLRASAENDSVIQKQPVQKKENQTGLPDDLKSGIENLSGYSLDDVKVHYNSNKPAQLQAYAFAQGTDIHVASGQEKHLPHEAWHVVQQKQGRVKPTLQMKAGVAVNDDTGLEKDADVMGEMAIQMLRNENTGNLNFRRNFQSVDVTQCMLIVGGNNIKRTVLAAAIQKGVKQSSIPDAYTKKQMGETVLNEAATGAIDKLMEIYKTKTLRLTDFTSLIHQASQDLHMLANGNESLIGIGHQNSQFTYSKDLIDREKKNLSFKSGVVEKSQRVYRTMTINDWENSYVSGHGGSIGQAMHYFNLGKSAHSKNKDRDPDLLVEFVFADKDLTDLVSGIEGGGEGKQSTDEKLGGKTEQNTAFGNAENIFSVDLKNASGLLSKDIVSAKVLASTNGVLPDQTKKGKNVTWQKRPN